MHPPFRVAVPQSEALSIMLAIVLLLAWREARAQAPAWQMAIATSEAGGYNYSNVAATAADASGNVYLTGSFSGTVGFGALSLTSDSNGPQDVFVAKWSSATNQFVWVLRAGGAGYDQGYGLALEGTSVYIVGSFNSPTANFGSATLSASSGQTFVAKVRDAGDTASFAWAQADGGNSSGASGVAVSGGSVYVVGGFSGRTATFSTTTLTNTNANGFPADAFVAKYTDAGTSARLVWVQQVGGAGSDNATAVAVLGTSVFVTGYFDSAALRIGNTTLANPGGAYSYDMFVAKLTDAGSTAAFDWAQQAGEAGDNRGAAIAASAAGVYVAGWFSKATFGTARLVSTGDKDVFVTKLTDAGSTSSFAWAQRAGGFGPDYAYALALDGPRVYIAGAFAGASADFGGTTLANATPATSDIFVASLVDEGSGSRFKWAVRAGGSGDDGARALAVGGGRVYAAGAVAPPATFGSQTLTGVAGSRASFLASVDVGGPLATASADAIAGLTASPNPAHSTLAVQFPNLPGITQATLTLVDALGRTVRTQHSQLPPAGSGTTLSLANLPPGLYRLYLRAGNLQVSRAVVVE